MLQADPIDTLFREKGRDFWTKYHYRVCKALLEEGVINKGSNILVSGSNWNVEIVALSLLDEVYDLGLRIAGIDSIDYMVQNGNDFLDRLGIDRQQFLIEIGDVRHIDRLHAFAERLPFDVILDLCTGPLCGVQPEERVPLLRRYAEYISDNGYLVVNPNESIEAYKVMMNQLSESLVEPSIVEVPKTSSKGESTYVRVYASPILKE